MTDSLAQANPQREPADAARFAETDVVLRDGRAVHLRSICASDEAELLQAFERLSPEARYMRFMRAVRSVDTARLRKTLAAFPQGGDTIIATIPAADGIDIVGGAPFRTHAAPFPPPPATPPPAAPRAHPPTSAP